MEIGQRLVAFPNGSGKVTNVWVFDGVNLVEKVRGVPKDLNIHDETLVKFMRFIAASRGLVAIPVSGVSHEFDLHAR